MHIFGKIVIMFLFHPIMYLTNVYLIPKRLPEMACLKEIKHDTVKFIIKKITKVLM